MKLIAIGDHNLFVKTAKIALNKRGYNLPVNPEFDTQMEKAVKDFQKKQGLMPDGIIGEGQTWKALLGRLLDWVFWHTADCMLDTNPDAIRNYDIALWGIGGYHYVYKADGTEIQHYAIKVATAGVAGMNYNSIHLSGIYGRAALKDVKAGQRTYIIPGNSSQVNVDNHTEAQEKAMIARTKALLAEYSHLIVLGHHQAPVVRENGKLCPIFDLREVLAKHQIPAENIYQIDTWNVIKYIKTGHW